MVGEREDICEIYIINVCAQRGGGRRHLKGIQSLEYAFYVTLYPSVIVYF